MSENRPAPRGGSLLKAEGCGGNLEGDGEELDGLDGLDVEDYGFRTLRCVTFWDMVGAGERG